MMSTNQLPPHTMIACSADDTTRNLTQPTELGGGLGWNRLYQPVFLRPGGIHTWAFLVWQAGSRRERPQGGIKMLTQTQLVPVDAIQLAIVPRKQVVETLKTFRKEWEATVSEQSLLDTYAPVALFLVDMVNGLNLSRSEAMDILGFSLWAECSNQVGEIGRVE